MRGLTRQSKLAVTARLSVSRRTAPICTTSLNWPGASQWPAMESGQAVNSKSKITKADNMLLARITASGLIKVLLTRLVEPGTVCDSLDFGGHGAYGRRSFASSVFQPAAGCAG